MIPERRLDDVCDLIMGQAPSGVAYNANKNGWPLIAGAGDFGDLYPEAKKFTTEASKLSQDGDVILGIRATIGEKVWSDGVYCLGRGVAALRPRRQLDPRYLWYWLANARPELASKAKGATFKQVNRNDIASLRIRLPPLATQGRIADVLDQAEALRARRRDAVASLDTFTSAVFLRLFDNPDAPSWPVATVADVSEARRGSIRTGPFGSQLLHSEFVESGVAVLGIDNAVANEFRWGEQRFISAAKYRTLERYTVRPGDVLVTIMGTCGRCAVVPDDIPLAITTKHLCCITVQREQCRPSFLHAYFLLHPAARAYLRRTAKGAIMSGLNMEIIKNLPIQLPPPDLQAEFDRVLAVVGKLKAAHRASAAQLDALFSSLQHRAFNGTL